MSLGKRIVQLREACGMDTAYALSKASGVPQSVVYDLESDSTKNPRQKTLERIAKAVGRSVKDLYDEEQVQTDRDSFTWFWRSRFSAMKPGLLWEMRNSSPETRVIWCLKELTAAFSVEETAAKIGCPASHITNLFHGTDVVSPWLMDQLAEVFGVPGGWLNTGHLEYAWVNDTLREVLNHPDAGTYLLVIKDAIELGVLPELLRRQIDLWKQATMSKPPTA